MSSVTTVCVTASLSGKQIFKVNTLNTYVYCNVQRQAKNKQKYCDPYEEISV